MTQIQNAMEALERIAPKRYAFPSDKVGLQVGDPHAELFRGVVSLDRSLAAVAYAVENDAQILVAHHPLIFEPVNSVLETLHVGKTILELARHGISFAAAHTNWDSARGGINDALAGIFQLSDVKDFGTGAGVKQLKLVVPCPAHAAEKVIDAASKAGAGVIGNYSRCAFTSIGTGTFFGNSDANPSVGQSGQIEQVDEVRIEMVLPEDRANAVVKAVTHAHPYEVPACDLFTLHSIQEQPAGRVGTLQSSMSLKQLSAFANERLDTASWAWGDPGRMIKKLAVVGGAADSEWWNARNAGADALLTGEVKQHVALEAGEQGFALIAAGHYATEQPGCKALRDRLAAEMPLVEWILHVPESGFSGRPMS